MGEKITDGQPRVKFDCTKCLAFRCSIYERVAVTKKDLRRLARFFKLSEDEAARKYTRIHKDSGERILKRAKDPVLGESCKFLDKQTRGCGIYHARPDVCREYPNRTRCAYYDVYRFEMRQQGDKRVLPIFQIRFMEEEEETEERVWELTPEN